MTCKLLVKTTAVFLLSSREAVENHRVNPCSYIGDVLKEVTSTVKDSITYNRANEHTSGERGGGWMALLRQELLFSWWDKSQEEGRGKIRPLK